MRISLKGEYALQAVFDLAAQRAGTPVKIAAIGVASNIALSLALMGPMKHLGLALANSLASGINFFILLYFLRRRLGMIDGRRIIRSFSRILVSSAVMGLSGWMLLHGERWQAGGDTLFKVLALTVVMVLCLGVYVVMGILLKSEELRYVRDLAAKKITGTRRIP